MADLSKLRDDISQKWGVKSNGTQAITGDKLKGAMLDVIDTLNDVKTDQDVFNREKQTLSQGLENQGTQIQEQGAKLSELEGKVDVNSSLIGEKFVKTTFAGRVAYDYIFFPFIGGHKYRISVDHAENGTYHLGNFGNPSSFVDINLWGKTSVEYTPSNDYNCLRIDIVRADQLITIEDLSNYIATTKEEIYNYIGKYSPCVNVFANGGTHYSNLTAALNAVPTDIRKAGSSIVFRNGSQLQFWIMKSNRVQDYADASAWERIYTSTDIDNFLATINSRFVSLDEICEGLGIALGNAVGYIKGTFDNTTAGTFIDSGGSVGRAGGFILSNPIHLKKGQTIDVTTASYGRSVSIVAEVKPNNTYAPLVNSVQTDLFNYKYIAEYDMDVVVSAKTDSKHTIYCYFAELDSREETFNFMTMFHKVGVIGDSLSSGEIAEDSSIPGYRVEDRYKYSWLSNICRWTGAEPKHYSHGGCYTKQWLESPRNYLEQISSDTTPCPAFFIALGTNDYYYKIQGTISYGVGNISDAAGTNSFIGYYKQIIESVRNINPKCCLFLVSLYHAGYEQTAYNSAIQQIAELYDSCYFVDFHGNGEYLLKGTQYASNGHYTTAGYVPVGGIIMKLTNRIIDDHISDFKYLGLDFE